MCLAVRAGFTGNGTMRISNLQLDKFNFASVSRKLFVIVPRTPNVLRVLRFTKQFFATISSNFSYFFADEKLLVEAPGLVSKLPKQCIPRNAQTDRKMISPTLLIFNRILDMASAQ